MKKYRATLSSSNVDAHGDVMTEQALQFLVEHIRSKWIPMGVEHDPRIPPQGRVLTAELKQRPDGVFIVEGVIQEFEPGDLVKAVPDEREIPTRSVPRGEVEIRFDRSFRVHDQMDHVDKIAAFLNGQTQEEVKKSVDPISVLTIVVGVAVGSFAKAFFGKLGEESATGLIAAAKGAFSKNEKRGDNDNLLVFSFCSDIDGESIEYQVILSNPSEKTIESFFAKGIKDLDSVAQSHFEGGDHLRRIVYDYDESGLSVRFAVRKDAFPLYPKVLNPDSGDEC